MAIQVVDKSITDVDGVYASSITVKEADSNLRMSYLFVPNTYSSAGVFTQHHFSASSVNYTKKCIRNHTIKAILITAGNANVATGKQGDDMTKSLAKKVAQSFHINKHEVAIAATGIIGKPLPADLDQKLDSLLGDRFKKESALFEKGILTTDNGPKTVFVEAKVGKKLISIAGVTKGCGMIEPNMATTLGFLVTNAAISTAHLNQCLKKAIAISYNMVSVDSDTSTSDMVLIQSTGEVAIAEHDTTQLAAFQEALNVACIQLAKQLVMDGEGAKKLIECNLTNAKSYDEARQLTKQVINSPLVKTAIAGENPNWGRLVMALGKNPSIKVNPTKVSIFYGDICIYKKGENVQNDKAILEQELKKDTVELTIDLGVGKYSAVGWGCDLNHTYIDINMEYN